MFLWQVVREYFVVMENRMEMVCVQGYCIVNGLLWELDINRILSCKAVRVDFR